MNVPPTIWTDEATAILIRMRLDGKGPTEIARAVGIRCTPKAVSGKMLRLALDGVLPMSGRKCGGRRTDQPDSGLYWAPDHDAELVHLYHVEDLSIGEVALKMRRTPAATQRRLAVLSQRECRATQLESNMLAQIMADGGFPQFAADLRTGNLLPIWVWPNRRAA